MSSASASRVYARILGTGSALPEQVVSNDALAARLAAWGVETSDAWITERTGIRQRYFAAAHETSATLGTAAARCALEAAQLPADQLDLIVLATSTPTHTFPATACLVQAQIGAAGCAAFDIQAVCSGFVYALGIADQFIRSGQARHALVIGAEVFSRILDFDDRSTCVLFGDGAGAVVLGAAEHPGIRVTQMHADGRHVEALHTWGVLAGGAVCGDPYLRMDGQTVFKLATAKLRESAQATLAKAGMTIDQLDWLVMHQANVRIMRATAQRLGLPEEKLAITVDRHGNTSAASVPLALDEYIRAGHIRPGQHVLLQGVGGGFTWATALLTL